MTGPSDVYFAVGFGNNEMSGTYVIIVDGHGAVTERILGHHSPGILLQNALTVTANEVVDGVRTVAILREADIYDDHYFNFEPFVADCEESVPLIYAHGFSESFGFHEEWGNGVSIHGQCDDDESGDADLQPAASDCEQHYVSAIVGLAVFILYHAGE